MSGFVRWSLPLGRNTTDPDEKSSLKFNVLFQAHLLLAESCAYQLYQWECLLLEATYYSLNKLFLTQNISVSLTLIVFFHHCLADFLSKYPFDWVGHIQYNHSYYLKSNWLLIKIMYAPCLITKPSDWIDIIISAGNTMQAMVI